MQKRIGLFAALLLFTFNVFAQTGTIKGFVYDKATGEPMIYTVVLLEGTKTGVQTDVNGFFSLRDIPAGNYTLMSTLLGYDTVRTSVVVKANDVITKKLFIAPQDRTLDVVEISARKTEKVTQINAGSTTITPREMKLLPSTGGEPDVAQYLQVVPGVIFTGDQGGQLYVRGGSPAQTGILLDGVTIYNPFHSIGLYSVFETDAIRNVEVQSAGFSAAYGNRTSAIIDIRTKDGNKNRLSGKLSASPIMARAMLEGPLIKPKTQEGASTTFLVSLKHSYLNSTSKSLYGGLGEPFKSGLPYSFTDLYGKLTFNGENGSKLNVFGFNFDDRAQVLDPKTHIETADLNWNAKGGGATFVVSPGSSSALINGRFAYSKYLLNYDEFNYIPRSSGIDAFEAAIDFTYFFPRYSQLKYGIELSGLHTTVDYANGFGQTTSLDRRSTQAALYLLYRKNFAEKLVFEPSLRVQYYAGLSTISPEPRLGLKYNISQNVRLKAAGGIYSQNIISTKSDRDIVNFFTGFVLSPDQQIRDEDGKFIDNNLQRAYHALGGLEIDIAGIEFNIEPWYKNFTRNIELSRNKIFPQDPDFDAGRGTAAGIDFSAKYTNNRVYLWGVFSYQKVTYKARVLEQLITETDANGNTTLYGQYEVQNYPPPFDRRVNVNALAAYTLGKKMDWEVSARYNLGSPFPFTQTQGFYEEVNMMQNGISTNVLTQNGQVGLLYANDINGGRLSYYHRLDLSVKKTFTLSQNSNIESTFSLTNAYNRNNIFYINRFEDVRVYQLPIFPSLNVTWNF